MIKMDFCGEIVYDLGVNANGDPQKNLWVHSDICYHNGLNNEDGMTEEYREFLHNCLNEWLNKSNGTGAFWVGDPEYFNEWGKEEMDI